MKKIGLGLVAITSLGLTLATAVEAQRFGGYYYTSQQTINMGGQQRVCKMYGLDFAKYTPGVSKVAKVAINPAPACQTQKGLWNGDCCKISYGNTGQAAGQAVGAPQQNAPARPKLR